MLVGYLGGYEDSHIRVEETGPTHAVGAASAEASARRLRERAWADPQAVAAGLDLAWLANALSDLGGTCGIEIAGIRLDRKRRTRIRAYSASRTSDGGPHVADSETLAEAIGWIVRLLA